MGLRGIKPKGRVLCKWSPNFAYAIGLLASDGCILNDGLHIDFTSKDMEQVLNFKKALKLEGLKIGSKFGGPNSGLNTYNRIQFGDVLFLSFLREVGLTPAKSRTLGALNIPDKYFFDFLRGVFDGDGYSYSYWDKRWKSSFMFYTGFVSASENYINWLRSKIKLFLKVKGHIDRIKAKGKRNEYFLLKFAKADSLPILKEMYKNKK